MIIKAFARRSLYRPASLVLLAAFLLLLASVSAGFLIWPLFLGSIASGVVLTIITYHRLRDGGLSGSWVLLMIMPPGLGPTWRIYDHLTFSLGSGILACLPVVLAWITPSRLEKSQAA